MKIPTQFISQVESLLTKGWKLSGMEKNFPILKKGDIEAVLDNSLKLIPKSSFARIMNDRKIAEQLVGERKSLEKQISTKVKKCVDFISKDAKKRQLGNLDFSPRNWFSYARGYRTPENSIKHYKEKFLPEIKDTYKELVDNHKLFFNGKQVIGVIDGKQIHLKNTESKMAYIVTNTPSGKKLYFNGEVASTGIPAQYKESFIRNGRNPNKPNWANTNLGAASYYSGDNGLIGIFTTIKPKLIRKYLGDIGPKDIPNKPVYVTPENVNPSSNRFTGPNAIENFMSSNPFAITEITRPIKDDIASEKLNYNVITKMRTIGQELPLKAILGNSGEFNMKNSNPFRVILPTALTSGGIYEATNEGTTDKERN